MFLPLRSLFLDFLDLQLDEPQGIVYFVASISILVHVLHVQLFARADNVVFEQINRGKQ